MTAAIGVLAYQGGFHRHIDVLTRLGRAVFPVRDVESAKKADALIIPGGESTTIGMLMERFGVMQVLLERIGSGELPVFGTCAGAILLARDIEGMNQPHLGLMSITVARNAYGRQIESFEASIPTPDSLGGDPFPGVFIRAPIITRVDASATVLLEYEDRPVLVREGTMLAATFHPELTADTRLHEFFLREFVDRSS